MPKTIAAAVMTAVVTLAAFSLPASAQINPFGRSDFALSEVDVTLLRAAAAKLYEGETAALETQEAWSNPKSGNAGTVRLVRIFKYNDLTCRRLQHDITLEDASDPFRFIIDRCQVSPGVWKIL